MNRLVVAHLSLLFLGNLCAGCARGSTSFVHLQDARLDQSVAVHDASERLDVRALDAARDASQDPGSDQAIADMSVDARAEVATTDAGPCLAIRGAHPFITNADTTGGVPFDRGFPTINTSDCPMTIPPSETTRGIPSRQFRLCNPSPSRVEFSIAAGASYDIWTAVYQGDEVPEDTLACVAMNDDNRQAISPTTNSFIPRVVLESGAVVTVVVVGITNAPMNRGPFELVITPL